MIPNCAACKHYKVNSVGSACGKDEAAIFDRVYGYMVPVLTSAFKPSEELAHRHETLSRCDRQGWFEPRRNWFSWRLA